MEGVEEVCVVSGGGARERRMSSGTDGPLLLAVEAGPMQVSIAGSERAQRQGVGSSSSECSQEAGPYS